MMRGTRARLLHQGPVPPAEIEPRESQGNLAIDSAPAAEKQVLPTLSADDKKLARKQFLCAVGLFLYCPPTDADSLFRELSILEKFARDYELFSDTTLDEVFEGLREYALDPMASEIRNEFSQQVPDIRPQGHSHDPATYEDRDYSSEDGRPHARFETTEVAGSLHLVTRPRDAGMTSH